MKKIIGPTLSSLALAVILLVIVDQSWADPTAVDPQILAHGHDVFNSGGCVNCHTADKAYPLAGGFKLESPFGIFYSPNITPDPKTGIGQWTEHEFFRALRKGISPRGEFYYPSFPFTSYTRLSNDDIHALWVYLQSVPAVEMANKAHEIKAPYNIRGLLFFWRILNFDQVFNHPGCNEYFARGTGHYDEDPTQSPLWNRGAYLVEGPLHCAACHTSRDSLGGYHVNLWMAGGPLYGTADKAPNITPDKETGLGTWTNQDWDTFLTRGENPDGDPVSGDMKMVVRNQTSKLSNEDRSAVIHYLMNLKPVKNKID